MSRLSLNGNILRIRCDDWEQVLKVLDSPLNQVTINFVPSDEETEAHFMVSRPLPESERGAYAFLYNRKKKESINPDPDDDGPRVA